jgi:hypothetical protein
LNGSELRRLTARAFEVGAGDLVQHPMVRIPLSELLQLLVRISYFSIRGA